MLKSLKNELCLTAEHRTLRLTPCKSASGQLWKTSMSPLHQPCFHFSAVHGELHSPSDALERKDIPLLAPADRTAEFPIVSPKDAIPGSYARFIGQVAETRESLRAAQGAGCEVSASPSPAQGASSAPAAAPAGVR